LNFVLFRGPIEIASMRSELSATTTRLFIEPRVRITCMFIDLLFGDRAPKL
jgi:hypothetical protein